MNKNQKELIQYQLDQEKAVLDNLKNTYQKALNDINRKIRLLQTDELTQSKIYQIEYQKALKGQIEGILEKMHGDEYSSIQSYLSDSYTDAFIGTMYDMHGQGIPLIMPIDQAAAVKAVQIDSQISHGLYTALGVDVQNLKKNITAEVTRGIASNLPYSDIARNINKVSGTGYSNASRIVRTEGHRVQQASAADARQKAKDKGADVVKQWDSTLDGRTRSLHRQLDGQIREIDEPFEADGKKASEPGMFGDPAEDCNCRCVALTRARWALDKSELQTLKDRADFFGMDKTKDFEDFKEKYIKASEKVEVLSQSSTIKVKKSLVGDGLESGKISKDINADKQNRHIKDRLDSLDSSKYINGRSYIDGDLEDCKKLVDELSGTGSPVMSKKGWTNKERVESDHVIGTYIDQSTGKATKTKKALIIYSKTGSHIVPRKDD